MNEGRKAIGVYLFVLLICASTVSCVSRPVKSDDTSFKKTTSSHLSNAIQSTESNIKDPLPSDATFSLKPNNVPKVTGEKGRGDVAVKMQIQQAKEESLPEESEERLSDPTDDDTAFQDLPAVEFDAEALRDAQNVGNDEVIKKELKRLLREFGETADDVPPVFVKEVKAYIRMFQANPQYRKFITASLRRSSMYLPFVKGVFNERNIPEDMAYIAFMESGFNTKARSRAGALGMWQFMPGTARAYSLKVTKDSDERLDPTKSTYAAVEYFHDLVAIFGSRSFMLALAAYNCGEYRIISCLKKIENPIEERHFWHVRSCLPEETREYPPRIIAAAIIGNNPEHFGFPTPKEAEGPILAAEESPPLEQRLPLNHKAAIVLRKADDQNRRSVQPRAPKQKVIDFTYTIAKGNTVRDIAATFQVDSADLMKWNKLKDGRLTQGRKLLVRVNAPIVTRKYTVKRGDTVGEIARSFRMSPRRIIVCNGLKNGYSLTNGQILVLHTESNLKHVSYTVKKGSTLTGIAKNYGVEVEDIMRWNNLNSVSIRPAQKLAIYL